MRHRKVSQRLERSTGHRKATLQSLAMNLLKYQKIKTTKVKARLAQPLLDRLIVLGKQNSLQARRKALRILNNRITVGQLFSQIAPLFKEKGSGFTRITNLAHRRGDGAELVLLELTEKLPIVKPAKPAKAKAEPEVAPSEKPKPEIKAEKKPKPVKEKLKPPKKLKPKKFLGGLRRLFKRERDSL